MLEGKFIETLSRIHGTKPYLSDAEIIPQADGFELVSVDSFSEREDFLHGLTPRQIGRQMAIGACADLLACGAKPETLLQSWTSEAVSDVISVASWDGVSLTRTWSMK